MIIDWRKVAVAADAPLLEALRVIDAGAIQFALVVDGEKLVGVVTDGDVRRALVRGLGTQAPIGDAMNRKPVLGTPGEGPAGWRRKMRKHGVRHLPVVDAAGVLLRVATDQSGGESRDNWAVLMAGGLGTRLRPITEHIPKPMIEVGGRPILETIVDSLAHCGFQRLFLSVNYRAELIEGHFGDGGAYGVRIEYLREQSRLGTAGALSMLPESPRTPLLVMNGDLLTGLDLGSFVDLHAESACGITVGVRELVTQIPYGVIERDGERVRAIREKPEVRSVVSAGIYALSPDVLPLVPRGNYFDMPTLIGRAIEEGHAVRAHDIEEYWIDVGRLDDLERARLEFDAGGEP
jgi:dTDP-glucose pyrophosphorylase